MCCQASRLTTVNVESMKFVKYTDITIFIFFILNLVLILFNGFNDDIQKSDVALILGNKVNRNGQPSERLKSRLDKGIELYQDGFCEFVIVSGGLGREGFDEATVMRQYLLDHSIPDSIIIVDSKGINTHNSAIQCDSIIKAKKWKSVIVVSNYYHIRRSKLALTNQGIENIYSAHAEYFEFRDIYSILREIPAYYVYLFR